MVAVFVANASSLWKCAWFLEDLRASAFSLSFPQLSSVRVKELCELLSYWNGASFLCKSQVRLVTVPNVSLLCCDCHDKCCYFLLDWAIYQDGYSVELTRESVEVPPRHWQSQRQQRLQLSGTSTSRRARRSFSSCFCALTCLQFH